MTDEGNRDADLWANTSPHPPAPPPPPPPVTGAIDPTQVLPVVSPDPTATTLQPATPPPMTPGGMPPAAPPIIPPTGGGGSGTPPGGQSPTGGRPEWAGPAVIGLLVGGVIAAIVVLVLTRGGNDSVQTVDESTTTVLIDTTIPVETTINPATTVLADTTVPPAETTIAPTTTEVTETTSVPTTEAPATTTAPTTTAAPAGPAPASPDTVRVNGVEFSIERSCFTVPLAPNNGDLQVFSHLIRIDDMPAIIEQWFDEGGITGGAFSVRGIPSDTGEFVELDQGYAFESPAGSGDFSIVANPPSTSSDCGSEQGIQTFDNDGDPQYLRALIDACSISDDTGASTMVGYGTDLGRVQISGNADGNYFMTYSDPAVQLDAAPAERLSDDGSVSYNALLGDGSVLVSTEDDLLRGCTDTDLE